MLPENAGGTALYVAIGADIITYAVDDQTLTLAPRSTVTAPEAVQYIWAHPRLSLLYVAFSNRGTSSRDDRHGVAVYRIDQHNGALTEFRLPIMLDSRPIHLTIAPSGLFMLVAYNMPSALTVHRLDDDGTVGAEVAQHEALDTGVYAHQVLVAPSGRLVVLSTRGNDPGTTSGDPGALKIFRFEDGQLSSTASISHGDELSFGPRHVDFHPAAPWLYVSLERGNQLLVYEVKGDSIADAPSFVRNTALQHGRSSAPVQYLGPIHLHPHGHTVYLVNRSDSTRPFAGGRVHDTGENSVACFALDPATGKPSLIQTIDTQGYHCRTFAVHPGGRMLVAAAVAPMAVQDGMSTRVVAAGLSVFGMEQDGTLRFVRKYDLDAAGGPVFWCGFVSLS